MDFPDGFYAFRHILTQETIYSSLLRSQRPGLHRTVAECIEYLYADDPSSQAEVLTLHYNRARVRDKAMRYALLAGGSAAYLRRQAAQTKHRPPIYVGYGHRDPAGRDSRKLGAALRSLGWPHKIVGRPRVGHTITDSQVREALAFFSVS